MAHTLQTSISAYPTAFWLAAATAIILVGIGKAGFGGGIGIIATPLIALTIPAAEAAALLLPLLIIADMFSVRHYHHTFDRASIKILLPGAIAGIAVGAFFFGYFSHNEQVLKTGIGALAVLFVLFQAGRSVIFGALEAHRPSNTMGTVLGSVSGFTSTLAHAGGPPAIVYLLPQHLPRNIFVGTTVILFTAINLIKLVPYAFLGLLKPGNLVAIIILSPLCYVGVKLGIYLNQHFTDYWFNIIVYILLFLTGLQLIMGQSFINLLFG